MGRTSVTPLSIIVAVDISGGFAKNGQIPWHYPQDLKHFNQITTNHPIVMGRRTYEEIYQMQQNRYQTNIEKNKQAISPDQLKQILPNRDCFVVTSNKQYNAPGATVVPSLRKAINSLSSTDEREVFVIGGQRLFIEGLSWAKRVYMTIIKQSYCCDRFFPIKAVYSNFSIEDGEENEDMYFITYRRKK